MKKAKKIIPKIFISVVCVVCVLAVLAYSAITFGPIKWNAWPWPSDYKQVAVDMSRNDIGSLVGHSLSESQFFEVVDNFSIDGWKIHSYFTDDSNEVKLVAKKTYVFPFSSTLVWSLDEA